MSLRNLSLVNTPPHPGRPALDELVPSRYALRIGEIDVLVISDGVLSLPSVMLGHNADPAVRKAWLDDMFLPQDMLEWGLNVVVVRSGGRTILIDAGLLETARQSRPTTRATGVNHEVEHEVGCNKQALRKRHRLDGGKNGDRKRADRNSPEKPSS